MKKIIAIFLIIYGLSIYNTSLATAACSIVQDG